MTTNRRRQRNYYTRPDVVREIEMVADLLPPARIRERLQKLYPNDVPELRTVQRIVADVREDESAPWTILDADGDEAALVLPVLRLLNAELGARSITRGAAECIVAVRRAAPDCPVDYVWRIAMQYHARRKRKATDFADLDLILAGGWWRERSALEFWRREIAVLSEQTDEPSEEEIRQMYEEAKALQETQNDAQE